MNGLAAIRRVCARATGAPTLRIVVSSSSDERGVAAWPAALIAWSPGFVSTPHRHPAMQLIMTVRGRLRIREGGTARWQQGCAAVVQSNAIHEVDARGRRVVLAYVHPESELGAALGELLAGDVTCVKPRLVSHWRNALGSPVRGERVESWVTRHLLNGKRPPPLDPRIRRVLTYVRRTIGSAADVSLPALAALAGLSPSRFLHLFRESLGVPLRPYIRWLRVQRAACELIAGAGLSKAAYRAGFADAAHMSRTFRRMLGMSPSEIARYVAASGAVSLLRS